MSDPGRGRRHFAIVLSMLASTACEGYIPTAPNSPDADLAGIEVSCNRVGGESLGWWAHCYPEYALYFDTFHKKFVPHGTVTWSSSNPRVATVDAGGIVRSVTIGEVEICGTFQGVTGGYRLSITERSCALAHPTFANTQCLGHKTLPCGVDWSGSTPKRPAPQLSALTQSPVSGQFE